LRLATLGEISERRTGRVTKRSGLPTERYNDDAGLDDAGLDADYIVVEIAKNLLGSEWLPEYVRQANTGGIESVLV
jgi:hypothetical protein